MMRVKKSHFGLRVKAIRWEKEKKEEENKKEKEGRRKKKKRRKAKVWKLCVWN